MEGLAWLFDELMSMVVMQQSSSGRSWSLPSIADVQAKSHQLAAFGFTTVDSPVMRPSSRLLVSQVYPIMSLAGKEFSTSCRIHKCKAGRLCKWLLRFHPTALSSLLCCIIAAS
jgi:hypothetical protein